MDCATSWEYKSLINELTQGMEKAKQLRVHLSSTSSEPQEFLLQRILSSYEKALLILKWSGSSIGQSQQPTPPGSTCGALESSTSVDGSPRSEELNRNFRDQQEQNVNASKKRKTLPTWTEQVKVSSDNGLEGPSDDGYSWRKYGQKDILGAKYPRSYYRCTYRHIQNCWATKQVQRSDEDATVFEITYRGVHTCNLAGTNNSVASTASPEKQEVIHKNNCSSNYQLQQPNQMLMNLRANLRVNTGDSENKNSTYPFSFPSTLTYFEDENQYFPISTHVDENLMGTYSPSFISPATSESNYFSVSACNMNSLGGAHNLQHSESDLTDLISATNSPIGGLDFSIDPAELDPNFNFTRSGFFT